MFGEYKKGIVAAVGAAAILLASFLTDDHVTTVEWLQITVAGVAAFQVWYFANHAVQPTVKAVLAAVAAALNFAIGVIPDHQFNLSDLVNLVIAALVAAGVWSIANRPVVQPTTARGV